jgi:pimeloyl-ACP methyl ester carboxylesterase
MPSLCLHASIVFLALVAASLNAQIAAAWKDPSPQQVRFVTVDKNVQLEVLDWGGSGRAVVLLAGGGNTAHIFDDFAPKLTGHCHVYGITRRGFGASSFVDPQGGAERLGADVLAVMDALKIEKPVLVGHSFAGAEMSAIANSHAEKIAGLVYMEAAYSYAFDNGKGANVMELQRLQPPQSPGPGEADEASFSALVKYHERVTGFRFPEAELRQQRKSTPTGSVGSYRDSPGGAMLMSVISGDKKFTAIPAPALIIFANPHGLGTGVDANTDPKVRTEAKAYSTQLSSLVTKQENAVKNGVPAARVITLAGAHHYVFLSNEADVLRELNAFLSQLR